MLRYTIGHAIFVVAAMAGLSAFAAPDAHVIVIGVDGLSPDGIRHADTPNMDRIMRNGAYSLHARAVFPSSSSPNWASMIMGAGPEQHGVNSNDWRVDKFILAPSATGPHGFFPTMFQLLKQQRPELNSVVCHDWGGFANLFAHADVNRVYHGKGADDTIDEAIRLWNESSPNLLFIHLDHVDHAGHESGHGTPEYYESVVEADQLIGRVLRAAESSPLRDSVYVIVTADHGGINKGHGGWSMAEMEIPWMIQGPGVQPGHEIATPINTYDTAATVIRLLGISPHPAWIARPVTEAFQK